MNLRELHQKAGNPDLTHWNIYNYFSIAQASLLTAGIDPLSFGDELTANELKKKMREESLIPFFSGEKEHTNWKVAISLLDVLSQGICSQSVNSGCIVLNVQKYGDGNWIADWVEEVTYEQMNVSFSDWARVNINKTIITRKELEKWYKNNGLLESTKPEAPKLILMVNPEPIIQKPLLGRIPISEALNGYTNPALELLTDVCVNQWSTFDSEDPTMTPPSQKEILIYATKKAPDYGDISANQIKQIDAIARSPQAKKGNAKKEG